MTKLYRVEIKETTTRSVWVVAEDEIQAEARATIGTLERVREKESYRGESLAVNEHSIAVKEEDHPWFY